MLNFIIAMALGSIIGNLIYDSIAWVSGRKNEKEAHN